MPAARFSHTLRGVRPRARMSSENDVNIAKFLSTRAETKLPAPCRRTSKPSATSPSSALRTVMRDTAEIRRQIALRGQRVVGPEDAAVDGLAQRPLQFLIQGQITATIQRAHCFGE